MGSVINVVSRLHLVVFDRFRMRVGSRYPGVPLMWIMFPADQVLSSCDRTLVIDNFSTSYSSFHLYLVLWINSSRFVTKQWYKCSQWGLGFLGCSFWDRILRSWVRTCNDLVFEIVICMSVSSVLSRSFRYTCDSFRRPGCSFGVSIIDQRDIIRVVECVYDGVHQWDPFIGVSVVGSQKEFKR